MPKIKFSHLFDDVIDRVYECFSNIQLNLGIAYQNLVTKLKFHKGECFDEENAEFTFFWKNYYEVTMLVEDVKIFPFFRAYKYRTIRIDKILLQLSLIYNFYWDSVEEKTLFILEIEYQDEFFGDLIKNEINEKDNLNVCENIEKYLYNIVKGLEVNNFCLINAPFIEIWKTISNPCIFFNIIAKELITILKDKELNINSILEIYEEKDKKADSLPVIQFSVDSIYLSFKFAKISMITNKKLTLPNQKMTLFIKNLNETKNIFGLSIKVFEPTTH